VWECKSVDVKAQEGIQRVGAWSGGNVDELTEILGDGIVVDQGECSNIYGNIEDVVECMGLV